MKLRMIDYMNDSKGKKIEFEIVVEPEMTILALRVLIYKQIGRIIDIRLDNTDVVLQNDKTLLACGIDEESILNLIEVPQIIIPDEIICSVTRFIFLDPIKLPCGVTAERHIIQKNGVCPITCQPLAHLMLESDLVMQDKVKNFFDLLEGNPFLEAIREYHQYQISENSQPNNITETNREMLLTLTQRYQFYYSANTFCTIGDDDIESLGDFIEDIEPSIPLSEGLIEAKLEILERLTPRKTQALPDTGYHSIQPHQSGISSFFRQQPPEDTTSDSTQLNPSNSTGFL